MTRCPTFNFQVSVMSKLLAKNIRTKVSFEITIRKIHVYIDFRWPWKWNQYFYLAIWEDKRSKIIFLPSFQLVTRFNSQNRNETSLLMNSDTLICIWILAFPIGVIQVSTPRKCSFLLDFSSFHDYWSNHFNLISTYLVGRKGVMWKTCFSASQNAKNDSHPKHKNQVRNRLFLTVRSSSMKDYTYHFVGST